MKIRHHRLVRAKNTNDFERLAEALIAVPKSELDKRQAEYERTKKAGKKRKAG